MASSEPTPTMEYSSPATRDGAAAFSVDRVRAWAVPLLLIVGAQFWSIFSELNYGRPIEWLLLGIALVLACIPAANRSVFAFLESIRHPSRASAMRIAIVISIIAAIYFPLTAWLQHRDFAPHWQDELSYAVQIQMLAHGRLWMPHHPLADFFDSFQLIVDPVYASMYFPGASFLYVPAAWLHIPFWIVSSIISGACVGLMYMVMTELMDGVAGALAALMLIGVSQFRLISVMAMGHPAIVLFALLMIYAWLRWRERPALRWIIILGIFSGWAAITRPLDALVVALPIGIDILVRTLRTPKRIEGAVASIRPPLLKTFIPLILAAAPFLAIQLVFDRGVTGSWLKTPFELYADRDYPGTTLGFHPFNPALRPVSQLPQKQKMHDIWTIPNIQRHQPATIVHTWLKRELPALFQLSLPHQLLIGLCPLSLLGLGCIRRRVVWLMVPLWIALFSLYTWFLAHYLLVILPAMFLWVLLGARQIELAWPRLRRGATVFVTLCIAILTVMELPELNRRVTDQMMDTSELRRIDAALASIDHRPAVVLFHFPAGGNPHIEPVYNIDVAWPDDAPVIRAHDLGGRNAEIFRYYAEHQPQRFFYRYDRGTGRLTFLGSAKELAGSGS